MKQDPIAAYLKQSLAALESAIDDKALLANAHAIATATIGALRPGNKIFIAGNGRSDADTQPIAGETPTIQQTHITFAHGIRDGIEQAMAHGPASK